MTRRLFSRRALDGWFGTVVRYTGFALLLYAALDGFKNPALLPAAVALIFFKNVAGGGQE